MESAHKADTDLPKWLVRAAASASIVGLYSASFRLKLVPSVRAGKMGLKFHVVGVGQCQEREGVPHEQSSESRVKIIFFWQVRLQYPRGTPSRAFRLMHDIP